MSDPLEGDSSSKNLPGLKGTNAAGGDGVFGTAEGGAGVIQSDVSVHGALNARTFRILDANLTTAKSVLSSDGNLIIGADFDRVVVDSHELVINDLVVNGQVANGADGQPLHIGNISAVTVKAGATTIDNSGVNAQAVSAVTVKAGLTTIDNTGVNAQGVVANSVGTLLLQVGSGDGRPVFVAAKNAFVIVGVGPDPTHQEGIGGQLQVRDKLGNHSIVLFGDDGVVKATRLDVPGGDCAEQFNIAAEAEDPGTVMVIGTDGALEPCKIGYDARVAGVISGAGDLKPGLVLNKNAGHHRAAIALIGTVYCKVDADCTPISAGDLLTTSSTLGHAMKAVDASRSFSAIIGKALKPLSNGKGLIPILVTR
jgi:hypothetical protein